MKKTALLLVAFMGLFAFNSISINAQAVQQGNFIFNVYYGGPNLTASILETTFVNAGAGDEVDRINSLGPIGGSVSYMIADKISLGVDANYTDVSISFTSQSVDTAGNSILFNTKAGFRTIRVFPRFDYHFSNSDQFDGYFGVGAGFRNRTYYTESDDPDYDASSEGINPIAFRLAVGGTYYLMENFGINLELGLGGGGLLRGGLALQF